MPRVRRVQVRCPRRADQLEVAGGLRRAADWAGAAVVYALEQQTGPRVVVLVLVEEAE